LQRLYPAFGFFSDGLQRKYWDEVFVFGGGKNKRWGNLFVFLGWKKVSPACSDPEYGRCNKTSDQVFRFGLGAELSGGFALVWRGAMQESRELMLIKCGRQDRSDY
jgi:hypothetical protein